MSYNNLLFYQDCFPQELIKIDKASQIVVGEFNFTLYIEKRMFFIYLL